MLVEGYHRLSAVLAVWEAPRLFIIFLTSAILVAISISAVTVRWAAGHSIETIQKEIGATEIRLLSRQVENSLDTIEQNLEGLLADPLLASTLTITSPDQKDTLSLVRQHQLISSDKAIALFNSDHELIYSRQGDRFEQQQPTSDWTNIIASLVEAPSAKLALIKSGEQAQLAMIETVTNNENVTGYVAHGFFLRADRLLGKADNTLSLIHI